MVDENSNNENGLDQEEEIDVYSDLYSTYTQVTSLTTNDVDNTTYPMTWKTVALFGSSTVGGLLFGYDTGVISGVLLSLKPQDLGRATISDWDKELITSITCLGCFVGSLLGSPLADKYGRRITLAIFCVLFIVAALWMALASNLVLLVFGRFVVGIAVGTAAQCTPVYLCEISPAKIRGQILALNSIAVTGGQFLSYIFAYGLYDVNGSWRILFGLSAVPAIIFLSMLDFIPESPRWLVSMSKYDSAKAALRMIYPTASPGQINLKFNELVINLSKLKHYQDEQTSLMVPLSVRSSRVTINSADYGSVANLRSLHSLMNEPSGTNHSNKTVHHRMEPRTKRALLIGCVLMFFQQITGFNAFMYYAPLIFSKLNSHNPLLPAMSIAFTNFLFTFLAVYLVDLVGSRSMLLNTIWIMTVGLLLSTIGFQHENVVVLLFAVSIFVAAYASAMGTIPWSSVEFLPLNRRSFGASCISCTNWLTNFVITASYLSVMNKIGTEDTMLFFALFSVMAWFFVYFWYPEVKGLSLEEIGKVFENGIDVHYVYRNYY